MLWKIIILFCFLAFFIGAASDLERATGLAKQMVMSFGMAESVSSCNKNTFHQKIRRAERVCVRERKKKERQTGKKKNYRPADRSIERERERESS